MSDGHPNFNGVWQALNEANWNLQAHDARAGAVTQPGVYPYRLHAGTGGACCSRSAQPRRAGVARGGRGRRPIPYTTDGRGEEA